MACKSPLYVGGNKVAFVEGVPEFDSARLARNFLRPVVKVDAEPDELAWLWFMGKAWVCSRTG